MNESEYLTDREMQSLWEIVGRGNASMMELLVPFIDERIEENINQTQELCRQENGERPAQYNEGYE